MKRTKLFKNDKTFLFASCKAKFQFISFQTSIMQHIKKCSSGRINIKDNLLVSYRFYASSEQESLTITCMQSKLPASYLLRYSE